MNELPCFIPVGDLAHGFAPDSNILEPVGELGGRRLSLFFADGRVIKHRFIDAETLVWRVTAGEGAGESAEERYRAVNPRPGIYFVDFVKGGERATSVSLVLDLSRGIFTAVLGRLPTRTDVEMPFVDRIAAGRELTGVKATFLHGSIDVPFTPAAPRHMPTTELVGKRVEYTYSLTERYEHVYLNGNFYAWHCLQGAEEGLCDVDRCHYYQLGEKFYLFVWREKIVPTLGIVLVDLERLRTSGKIFGYQGDDFGRLSNFPVGATARILSADLEVREVAMEKDAAAWGR